jgi:hypothetical protein
MKQKDVALIIAIAFIAGIISLLISNAIFASPKQRQQKVEVVQPITADFPNPDSHYFNKDAFDPTKTITIGQNANADPFKGDGSSQ